MRCIKQVNKFVFVEFISQYSEALVSSLSFLLFIVRNTTLISCMRSMLIIKKCLFNPTGLSYQLALICWMKKHIFQLQMWLSKNFIDSKQQGIYWPTLFVLTLIALFSWSFFCRFALDLTDLFAVSYEF